MSRLLKSRNDCDEKQLKFLIALESPEAAEVFPRKARWRWAATQAGYDDSVSIASITAPLQNLIKEVAEAILQRAAVEAAWTLADAVGDGVIDAQTKDRISAAKDTLDRVVPKKGESSDKRAAPIAVLVLPAKQQLNLIESVNELPPVQEG